MTCDPVGIVEIAERVGRKVTTIRNRWVVAPGFPAPLGRVSGRDAWNWPDVVEWMERTGKEKR